MPKISPIVSLFLTAFLMVVPECSAADTFCYPQNAKYSIATKADAAAFPSSCTYVEGSVEIICTPNASTGGAGGIDSLSFLSNVRYINGHLIIQNCDVLPTLEGLERLGVIAGSSTEGLKIWNNDLLTDIKPLEGLQSIASGGVNIYHNNELCYLDLFGFSRIVAYASLDPTLIKFNMLPSGCSALGCDGSCDCGYCGGPGRCAASCSSDSLAWIAAPIIVGILLLALLIFCCYRMKKKGLLGCDCYCSLTKPLPSEKKQGTNSPSKLRTRNKVTPVSYSQLQSYNSSSTANANNSNNPPTAGNSAVPRPQAFPTVRSGATITSPATTLPRLNAAATAGYATNPRLAPLVNPAPAYAQVMPIASGLATASSLNSSMNGGSAVVKDSNCVCGEKAEFDCSRCGIQGYCSSECQRSNWKDHREDCRKYSKNARTARTAVTNLANLGQCAVCGKAAEFECSRCNGPCYCSATCQRNHWMVHSAECKKAAAPKPTTPPGTVEASQPAITVSTGRHRSSTIDTDTDNDDDAEEGLVSRRVLEQAVKEVERERTLDTVSEERESLLSAKPGNDSHL